MERHSGERLRWSKPGASAASLILILSLYLLPGCAATGTSPPYAGQSPVRPVWLVAPGWHTGLVVRQSDIPPEFFPESADFPDAEFLEIGWGERDYYQARESSAWLALKAALVPSPSVLHVVGFRGPPDIYFGSAEVLRIELPEPGLRRLAAYLHGSVSRRGARRAASIGPGLYGDSRFYEAEGQFDLFNNCNVWTARALQAAGLPITPSRAVTAGNLRCQVRRSMPAPLATNGKSRSSERIAESAAAAGPGAERGSAPPTACIRTEQAYVETRRNCAHTAPKKTGAQAPEVSGGNFIR
jgi:uncharacterized protein (TIGR02117 family)